MHIYEGSDQSDTLVAHKSDDSPLTLADLASHHTIIDGLRYLTPEVPVVSEEDPQSPQNRVPLRKLVSTP